jgi:hypothetical protein
MGTAKHLALEKFEAVDMALRGPITPGQRAGSTHSGRVSTHAEDLAAQFRHTARFRSLEPPISCRHLPFFEQSYKFLAQQVDGVEFLMEVHLLKPLLLHRRRV